MSSSGIFYIFNRSERTISLIGRDKVVLNPMNFKP
jgi:hypothetical protein